MKRPGFCVPVFGILILFLLVLSGMPDPDLIPGEQNIQKDGSGGPGLRPSILEEYPELDYEVNKIRTFECSRPSKAASTRVDYDAGIDSSDTYYVSSGIQQWGYASVGEVGKPVRVHIRLKNFGSFPMDNIIVRCRIFLWFDIGSLNAGPIMFNESAIVNLPGGVGSVSQGIDFFWTPEQAQSFMINVNFTSDYDDYDSIKGNNDGWFTGLQTPPDPPARFFTGMFVNSWSNRCKTPTDFQGDIGGNNTWHIVEDVPITSSNAHTEDGAWWCGNDSSGNCSEVWSKLSLVTETVSLKDYDPFAKDPEYPGSPEYQPQIFFNYKWAGNISLGSSGGLYTYISDDGGLSWHPLLKTDEGTPIAVNGTTWSETNSRYEWSYWTYKTTTGYYRYGIPIGDYVGKDVRFKLEYEPGAVNETKDIGYYIDDLIVWGRQKVQWQGFELVEPVQKSGAIFPNGTAVFNYTLKNIEGLPQDVRVSLVDGPYGWFEGENVVLSKGHFLIPSKPDVYKMSVSIVPPSKVLAGNYSFTLQFTGSVTKKASFNVSILAIEGITLQTERTYQYNQSGDVSVFPFTITNFGNRPIVLNLTQKVKPNSWANISDDPSGYGRLAQVPLGNEGSKELFFVVKLPSSAPPEYYEYTIEARINGTNISKELNFTVEVKQYFDLELFVLNDHQILKPGSMVENRTSEFTLKISNKGNGYDTFSLVSQAVLTTENGLKPLIQITNNTIAPDTVNTATWSLVFPTNASAGYHNFTIKVVSPNPDMDYSDNQKLISILIQYPEPDIFMNITFNDSLRVEPANPSKGMSVDLSIPVLNNGNTLVDLKVILVIPGYENQTRSYFGLKEAEEEIFSFSHTFLDTGEYNITLVCQLFSNLTNDFFLQRIVSIDLPVGYIDLTVNEVSVYYKKEWVDPAEGHVMPGKSHELHLNFTNLGTVGATQIYANVVLINGDNSTILYDSVIEDLPPGAFYPVLLPFQGEFLGKDILIRAEITSEMGSYEKMDHNISNNQLSRSYEVKQEEPEPDEFAGLLLIAIAVIFFCLLVFIILMFYFRRGGSDEEEEEEEDMDIDALLNDPEITVDFLDDEDELGEVDEDELGGVDEDELGGVEGDVLGGIGEDELGGIGEDELGGIGEDELGGNSDDSDNKVEVDSKDTAGR